MDKESKWMNDFPSKYKELFENYKNIEMFQNIYDDPIEKNSIEQNNDDESFIEGFTFIKSFDMHKSRGVVTNNNAYKKLTDFLKKIIDYILCPFTKSDELIDKGIQTLFKAFLYAECGDENNPSTYSNRSNKFNVNLSQLIDEKLLFFEKFQNKEGLKNRIKVEKNRIKVDCNNRTSEQQKKELKSISQTIREQIYKIMFLPLVFHIFYNCYFMFCFKDEWSEKPDFIDVESEYYMEYVYPNFNYIFGIVVQPLFWLYWGLNWFSNWPYWRSWTDKYPYLFYFLFFFIIFGGISIMGKNALRFIYVLLSGKVNVFTNGLISFIVGWEFIKALINETLDIRLGWPVTILLNPIVGLIKWLIYWIVRMVITILLDKSGFSAYLCNMYVAIYILFGIYISQKKDVFEVYKDIDHSIYKKIYEIFNSTCDTWDSIFSMATFYYIFQMSAKYSVAFLTELTIFYILYKGYYSYSNIRNINVKSFLYILNFTIIFILGAWTIIKHNNGAIRKIDEKYDYVVKELARKLKKTEPDITNNEKPIINKPKAEEKNNTEESTQKSSENMVEDALDEAAAEVDIREKK